MDFSRNTLKERKRGQEKSEKLSNDAKIEQKFLRRFGHQYFKKNEHNIPLDGVWKCVSEMVTVAKNDNFYQFKWTDWKRNYSIVLNPENSLSIIGSGSFYPKEGGMSESLIVLAIINEFQINLLAYSKTFKPEKLFFDLKRDL